MEEKVVPHRIFYQCIIHQSTFVILQIYDLARLIFVLSIHDGKRFLVFCFKHTKLQVRLFRYRHIVILTKVEVFKGNSMLSLSLINQGYQWPEYPTMNCISNQYQMCKITFNQSSIQHNVKHFNYTLNDFNQQKYHILYIRQLRP